MQISHYTCGSCAVSSIEDLGMCKNAEKAMATFCRTELGRKTSFNNPPGKLVNFYVFCAGPEVPQDAPGGSHHSKPWVKYGTEFAQFILDNRLGTVVTQGPKLNMKHHPKSTAQVWVWSPNQKAVELWWLEYCKGVKE